MSVEKAFSIHFVIEGNRFEGVDKSGEDYSCRYLQFNWHSSTYTLTLMRMMYVYYKQRPPIYCSKDLAEGFVSQSACFMER